ncbi:hypothetical protein ES288_D11G400600v1 [Gossypium darwinii]|uniref:Uncharacterized protein n=1 Tax=Gossypium darwinii TaxID=34276 RepID=A0A5D2AXG7_GOSDA|nr:hypothetical protein ES288_D11G400300v1 [Gossypium darwinii]TYG48151.1 hypothetical protein ES288_D11G400600v1 [Gossypium darwinii]
MTHLHSSIIRPPPMNTLQQAGDLFSPLNVASSRLRGMHYACLRRGKSRCGRNGDVGKIQEPGISPFQCTPDEILQVLNDDVSGSA